MLILLIVIGLLGTVVSDENVLLSPDGKKKFVVVEAGKVDAIKENSNQDNFHPNSKQGTQKTHTIRYFWQKVLSIYRITR